MKRVIFYILVGAIVTLIHTSCWIPSPADDVKSFKAVEIKATIDGYYQVTSNYNYSWSKTLGNNRTFAVELKTEAVATLHAYALGKNKATYEKYQALYNDYPETAKTIMIETKTNGRTATMGDSGYHCLLQSINQIDIIAVRDWNESHKAGASLNDIFMVDCYTLKPFFDNGLTGEVLHHVVCAVDKVKEQPLEMIAPYWFKHPDLNQQLNDFYLLFTASEPTTVEWPEVAVAITYGNGLIVEYPLLLNNTQQ